jgi:hypothetical protein
MLLLFGKNFLLNGREYLLMDPLHALLFPGVLFHEFAHYASCKLVGVQVTKVKFTSVTHSRPDPWKAFVISFAPFLVGNVGGVLALWVGHQGLLAMQSPPLAKQLLAVGLFYWIGLSLLTFSFASDADAKNALDVLIGFYKERLMLKHGVLSGIAWFFTLPFLFFPFLAAGFLMLLFSKVRGLGVAWAVVFFLGLGFLAGVWSLF